MKLFNRSKWIDEPLLSIGTEKKETEKLAEALRRCKMQNALLWQLLEKHEIAVPEEIIDPTDLDLLGKEAYIISEIESINSQLRILTEIIQLYFFK